MRWALIRVSTDERVSASLSHLREDHDILDLMDYYEMLELMDDED